MLLNVPAARNAKIAEPRLVTLFVGTNTGRPSTFAYTRFRTSFFCGIPPALITRCTRTPLLDIRSKITRVCSAVPSIAANSSSCAVLCKFHPSVIPRRFGFTRTVRSPLSQVMRSKPVCPARYFSKPWLRVATSVPARAAIALKMSPTAESPASIPVRKG